MKTCTKCGELKPLTGFYRDKSKVDGRHGFCKACRDLIKKAWLKANPEKVLAQTRKWRLAHPDEKRAANRNWEKAHPEKARAARRKWRLANPEKDRAAVRMRHLANPEKFRAAARKWGKENPEKVNARCSRRAAAKLRAVPKWSETELIKIVYKKASEMGFQVDHVVPLQSKSVCGLHVWSNLQLLFGTENAKKGNRHWPDAWERLA